jgi:hypothetical protein
MKYLQNRSRWHIVIGILLLFLFAGTIVVAKETVCSNRTESVADKDPLWWQSVTQVAQAFAHWWHCKEFVDFANEKVLPAIKKAAPEIESEITHNRIRVR